eukprot:1063550-Alexandrium_andersonii.AAC.1
MGPTCHASVPVQSALRAVCQGRTVFASTCWPASAHACAMRRLWRIWKVATLQSATRHDADEPLGQSASQVHHKRTSKQQVMARRCCHLGGTTRARMPWESRDRLPDESRTGCACHTVSFKPLRWFQNVHI